MASTKLDPIQLSIFSHRFMSIAGEWTLLSSLSTGIYDVGHGGGVAFWTKVQTNGVALALVTRGNLVSVPSGKAGPLLVVG